MAAHKGHPKTGGRKRGVPNKATAEIKALAQEHGPKMIKKLVALTGSKDERTQIAAIRELLDRGYGRAAQAVTMTTDVGENFIKTLEALQYFRGNGAIPADAPEMGSVPGKPPPVCH